MQNLIIIVLLALITSTQITLGMEQRFSQEELAAEAEHVKTEAHAKKMRGNIGAITSIYSASGQSLLQDADETNLGANFLESRRILRIQINLLDKYTSESDRKRQQISFCQQQLNFLNQAATIRGI